MKDPNLPAGLACRLIELGTRLTQAPEGRCSFCTQSFDLSQSTAKIARCFCSQQCEQGYIRVRITRINAELDSEDWLDVALVAVLLKLHRCI